jgi:hypothetical protein
MTALVTAAPDELCSELTAVGVEALSKGVIAAIFHVSAPNWLRIV